MEMKYKMTYTRLELVKITCDECGEEETLEIDPDYGIPEEEESRWFDELKKDGWTYNKENGAHYCPECVKDLREMEEE